LQRSSKHDAAVVVVVDDDGDDDDETSIHGPCLKALPDITVAGANTKTEI